jgi:hypothetical protein
MLCSVHAFIECLAARNDSGRLQAPGDRKIHGATADATRHRETVLALILNDIAELPDPFRPSNSRSGANTRCVPAHLRGGLHT